MTDKTDFVLPPDYPHDNSGTLDEKRGVHPSENYRLKLSVFEGPIDLLLYLIRKRELDIHEVSLAEIAKEYLDYVELIKIIDLESAGNFMVIASTLLKIKARSLFHPTENEGEEPEIEAAKKALIQYLLEYEKFGTIAEKLSEKEDERLGVFPRGGEKQRISELSDKEEKEPEYILFDLLTALREVLKTAPKVPTFDVELLKVTSEMKQREILSALKKQGKVDFFTLVAGQPKLIIVITFIAMLELIKNRKIRIRQSQQFGRIVLVKRDDDENTNS
jgi:segregation and condensation protein A